MKTPCDTCLKFAICVGHKQIRCTDFHDYFGEIYRQRKQEIREDFSMTHLTTMLENNAWDYAWDKVKETFPNAINFRTNIHPKEKGARQNVAVYTK